MAIYLATRIIEEAYTYDYAIGKKPSLKEGIEAYLMEKGREDLITK